MKQILVSEDALESLKAMAQKTQEQRDMLLVAAKHLKSAISFRSAVYCAGESQKFEFANQEMWNAVDKLSEAIAKVEGE